MAYENGACMEGEGCKCECVRSCVFIQGATREGSYLIQIAFVFSRGAIREGKLIVTTQNAMEKIKSKIVS